MRDIIDKILRELKTINQEIDDSWIRSKRHSHLINRLYGLFQNFGFTAIKEHKIRYIGKNSRRKHADDKQGVKNGQIDLVALNAYRPFIAVEYDNALTLKWKSIEKLLQCSANLCLGIVYGKKDGNKEKLNEKFTQSRARIQRTRSILSQLLPSSINSQVRNKKIYLVQLTTQRMELV